MNLRSLKYRLARWAKATFAPPRYFVATYGDMGLEVEFFRDKAPYDEAVEEAKEQHDTDNIDTWTNGDVE